MSDDREISAAQERAEASEATDRQHGEHILNAVAAQEDRRQRRAEDPVLEVLRQAHQAKAEGGQEE